MAGVARQKPIDVFEENMAGAERLIVLTKALLNTRTYRMRRERREALGTALAVPKKDWDALDWVESSDVFVILKPDGTLKRHHFTEAELRPLLRQAVVAIAAAVESYVAEKACGFIGEAFKNPPARLASLAVSLGDVLAIEERYQRRKWGYRDLVESFVVREASASPAKIGIVFSTVGRKGFWKSVDRKRGVPEGTSACELDELAKRRNRIAHTGDRVGRKSATLDVETVEAHFGNAKAIVEALEAVL